MRTRDVDRKLEINSAKEGEQLNKYKFVCLLNACTFRSQYGMREFISNRKRKREREK